MARINTNEDLVRDLMRFSPTGALGQMFIIEAIRSYAKGVSEWGQAEIMDAQEKNGLIDMEAWHRTALDVKARCDKFYNR